jgi:hypothetical protein
LSRDSVVELEIYAKLCQLLVISSKSMPPRSFLDYDLDKVPVWSVGKEIDQYIEAGSEIENLTDTELTVYFQDANQSPDAALYWYGYTSSNPVPGWQRFKFQRPSNRTI